MACLTSTFSCRTLPYSLAVAILAAGCGPSRPTTMPVEGVVTLDGEPVEGASVMFAPEDGGRPALGVTDKGGKFALKTFEPGDGALPGKHQVTVRKVEMSGIQADRDGLSGPAIPGKIQEMWITPKKYSNAASCTSCF